MNVELLQQVKAYVLAEPRRLDMSVIMHVSHDAPCGSAGCIDGWAQYLTKRDSLIHNRPVEIVPYYDAHYSTGRSILGLNEHEAERLFTPPGEFGPYFGESWPSDLAERYANAHYNEDKKEMANITAERIDRFIASNGEE